MHSHFTPLVEEFDDYIARPKSNGYQSLHTTLFGPNGMPIEVQIRTEDMHRVAESGIAAHWQYKAGEAQGRAYSDHAHEWLKQLMEMQQSGNSEEFMESVKLDLFPDKVYVFTPKGDIRHLPRNSTAVDFAYDVHTVVGNHCVAAKIDRRLVPHEPGRHVGMFGGRPGLRERFFEDVVGDFAGGIVGRLDERIGPKFLNAGIGFGGSCFPKDVTALKQLAVNSGYHFQLLNSVIEVNELQKRRVIGKLEKHLGTLVGKRIALLGLAFKPNTDDMREASSLVLAARLQAAGATVTAFDPISGEVAAPMLRGVELADDALGAVKDADAVVLVTEWQEFRDLDLAAVKDAMAGDVLVDGRNALDGAKAAAAGLRSEGMGRSSHEPARAASPVSGG